MAEVGAFQARTHLPKLLERVQNGERFVITKHGHPIAALMPYLQRELVLAGIAIHHLLHNQRASDAIRPACAAKLP